MKEINVFFFFLILFKEQTELLGNFIHLSDSPDRIECCGLMPFFLIGRTATKNFTCDSQGVRTRQEGQISSGNFCKVAGNSAKP